MNKPTGKRIPLLDSLLNRAVPPVAAPLQQEAQLRIEYKPGGVRICFSQPVTWVGFDPAGAEELAATLVEFAKLAREPAPEEPRIVLPE